MHHYTPFRQSLKRLEEMFTFYRTSGMAQPAHIQEAIRDSVVRRFAICHRCVCNALKWHLREVMGVSDVPYVSKPLFRTASEYRLLPSGVEKWFAYLHARINVSEDCTDEDLRDAFELAGDFIQDAVLLYETVSRKRWGSDEAIDIAMTAPQKDLLLRLLRKHLPNGKVWVYGSRTRESSRPESDLDMVVFPTPEQKPRVFELREEFEESDLPFRVSLLIWDELPEHFHKAIREHYVELRSQET